MDERWYTMDRPKSKYPKMSMSDRAAQFAPFAALTGHKEAILEQQRTTQTKRILSNEYLNRVLSFKRIDELNKVLYFKENIQIQIDDIVDIEVLEK